MPPPSPLPLPPSPPLPFTTTISLTASGSVSDYDESRKAQIASLIAEKAGVDSSTITVTVMGASVAVNIVINSPTSRAQTSVLSALGDDSFSSAQQATSFFSALAITVETAPRVHTAELTPPEPRSPPQSPSSLFWPPAPTAPVVITPTSGLATSNLAAAAAARQVHLLSTILGGVGGLLGLLLVCCCLCLALFVRKANREQQGGVDDGISFSPMKPPHECEIDGLPTSSAPPPEVSGDSEKGSSPPRVVYNERLNRARNAARLARARSSVEVRLSSVSSCVSNSVSNSVSSSSCVQSRVPAPTASPALVGRRSRVPAPTPEGLACGASPYKELTPDRPDDSDDSPRSDLESDSPRGGIAI